MNEAAEFLKGELSRVQNERDAAQANERQQLRVVAELRQQVGVLLATVEITKGESEDDRCLTVECLEATLKRVEESEKRIAEINKTRAVV